jgi:pyruvate,water dikinase
VVGKITGWQAITGRKAMEIISNFDKYFDGQVKNVISGKTGNKGYFKGRVRVIHFEVKGKTIKEINKMKKGEVLVSESTGPEMILACRKAGAIVTEQGGITSHAALVSRELGIPCVIGTKIATKVLKDGDLVEVDANKGIVKILNN